MMRHFNVHDISFIDLANRKMENEAAFMWNANKIRWMLLSVWLKGKSIEWFEWLDFNIL